MNHEKFETVLLKFYWFDDGPSRMICYTLSTLVLLALNPISLAGPYHQLHRTLIGIYDFEDDGENTLHTSNGSR